MDVEISVGYLSHAVDIPVYNTWDISDTYHFNNDGRTFILIQRENANVDVTLTIQTPKGAGGPFNPGIDDVEIDTEAGNIPYGPFDPDIFNNDDGNVEFTVDAAVNNCRVSLLRL